MVLSAFYLTFHQTFIFHFQVHCFLSHILILTLSQLIIDAFPAPSVIIRIYAFDVYLFGEADSLVIWISFYMVLNANEKIGRIFRAAIRLQMLCSWVFSLYWRIERLKDWKIEGYYFCQLHQKIMISEKSKINKYYYKKNQ